jgi:itaconyl-CoA hydratase
MIRAVPHFEDLRAGDRFRSRIGRTITEADNVWFTALTMNTNEIHFNAAYAEGTEWGRPLVNSALTLAVVMGLSVADTSETGGVNLGWEEIRLVAPVFHGDTLWAETEVLEARASRSRPGSGVVTVSTRGVNQRGETVIEFRRTFLCPGRDAGAA